MKLPWMSRRARRTWRTVLALQDLGAVMALWLECELDSRPGYQPRYGPDEETRNLLPVLTAACRAGYVTTDSQPGCHQVDPDGTVWRQRATVQGWVEDEVLLGRLVRAARAAGLHATVHAPATAPGPKAVPVTTRNDEVMTAFGGPLSRRDISGMWRELNRQALKAVLAAPRLTLVDPCWGPSNCLWETLADAVAYGGENGRCIGCGCTDKRACLGGCWWVSRGVHDLCSSCAPDTRMPDHYVVDDETSA
ncbi:DUF6919 domain-containing protein [Streptomyces sp. 3N207]|uniref:DUF6919 domain-containing protein n=1 Tax=Streptomyces sp. 3N207 TaxID=3457417 RepID=UPI003FD0174E